MDATLLTGADVAAVLKVLPKEKADLLLQYLPVDVQALYAQHKETGSDVVSDTLKKFQDQRDAVPNPLQERKP